MSSAVQRRCRLALWALALGLALAHVALAGPPSSTFVEGSSADSDSSRVGSEGDVAGEGTGRQCHVDFEQDAPPQSVQGGEDQRCPSRKVPEAAASAEGVSEAATSSRAESAPEEGQSGQVKERHSVVEDKSDDNNEGPFGALEEQPLQVALLWMAPFLSSGGYGSEAVSYASSLAQSGLVKKFRIGQHGDGINWDFISGLPAETQELLQQLFEGSYGGASKSVVVCHSEPGAWHPPLFETAPCPPAGYGRKGQYVIGRTMFETDRVLPSHVERCNKMDEVWVPAQFHMDTFARSGVDPAKLFKVPQAVDTSVFAPLPPGNTRPLLSSLGLPQADLVFGTDTLHLLKRHAPSKKRPTPEDSSSNPRPFVFLSIFKWETRKGWDILVKAYLSEFTASDNVALYLLTNPYHSNSDFKPKIRAFAASAGISEPAQGWPTLYVQPGHVPQSVLPSVYRACDAFVLPSRGEGWGRPHVEAMASGLPVLATNWSGISEYLSPATGFPIAVEALVPVEEGVFKGHLWAQPCGAHLQRQMRRVLEHPAEAEAVAARGRAVMQERYSPAAVARVVLERLRNIEKKMEGGND